MEQRQVIIVGGGIAGVASAWALADAGVARVLLLDAADQPGSHSTGRNAAILRSAIPDPTLHALAKESAEFYRSPPPGFAAGPLLQRVGVFLTAPDGPDADALAGWISDPVCACGGEEVAWSKVRQRHPYLQDLPARAWFFPDDGVLDVHAILHAFLHHAQGAGAELRARCPVVELLTEGDQVIGVATSSQRFHADAVLLAEGGWAGRLTAPLGPGPSFHPHRRHLVVSGRDPRIDPQAPVVWNLGSDEFYFRPESGGMLMSACDHVAVTAEQGEVLEREILGQVAEKALRWLPGLDHPTAAHAWAGMRTFPAGAGFHIGPDPRWGGLYWAAGLGGHGITCAPAIGRLAARLLLEGCPGIARDGLVTSLD